MADGGSGSAVARYGEGWPTALAVRAAFFSCGSGCCRSGLGSVWRLRAPRVGEIEPEVPRLRFRPLIADENFARDDNLADGEEW